MDQQRRGTAPAPFPAASSSSSSSPLLAIPDDFYELLHHGSSTSRSHLFSPPPLKMEPELGDFYTWGGSGSGTSFAPVVPHLYNDTNTLSSLTGCYATPAGAQLPLPPVVDIIAPYTPSVAQPASTTAQIQALRDFMVYGNLTPPPATLTSRATTPGVGVGVGVGGFYSDDVVVTTEGVIPSLAYRALCSEIYATTERSPHRSQFQRENHILAERQRREEMNEKFSALRAMIPKATKKDKASIVGDTIDYVLELEKRLKQLQACKGSVISGGGGGVKKKKRKARCEDGASTSSETTTTRNTSGAPPVVVGEGSAVSSPSDHITAESKMSEKAKEVTTTEVDVQQLGKQAVVKVVCNWRPGHVLRVLNALEECKVEVLQSNVMTIADNSIHFVTIQLEEGVSVPNEEIVSAVLQAINPAEG